MSNLIIKSAQPINGEISVPGDKSISHRSIMLASLAQGASRIKGVLKGHDCLATLAVMKKLGVEIEDNGKEILIHGQGRLGLKEPHNILDCQNSGTTIRILLGILASQPFYTVLTGTEQIRLRPMKRVIEPLKLMGANIWGREDGNLAPISTCGTPLNFFEHTLKQKSAQVKSCLIMAGLLNQGVLIKNTKDTRDHTEIMLKHMGAKIECNEDEVRVFPLEKELVPLNITIPADPSSAAFLIVLALIKGQSLLLKNVCVNETRIGIIKALRTMGGKITFQNEQTSWGEKVADILVEKSQLCGAEFSKNAIVTMIDEIPILALAATQAQGKTVIKDAQELKVKESNRIFTTVTELSKMGANITETVEGMIIQGPTPLKNAVVQSYQDHRIALMLAVAGMISKEGCELQGWQVFDDSFPGFLSISGLNFLQK